MRKDRLVHKVHPATEAGNAWQIRSIGGTPVSQDTITLFPPPTSTPLNSTVTHHYRPAFNIPGYNTRGRPATQHLGLGNTCPT